MMDIQETKHKLRKSIKEKLKALDQGQKSRESRQVLYRLSQLEQWKRAEVVLAFLSMRDELDNAGILRQVLEAGKKLAVPKVVGDDLVFYQVTDLEKDLSTGAFGIMEPVSGLLELDMKSLSDGYSVILVPGLAFDRENYRLGRGKGFYDRFFASAGDSLYKIGIGYSFQLVDRVPREPHDHKLDAVITGQ